MDMKTQTRRTYSVLHLSMTMLLLAVVATANAEISEEPRVSTNSQGLMGGEQGGIANGGQSLDELGPLLITGTRDKSTRGSAQREALGAGTGTSIQTPNVEFWIYDASVELFSDWDQDGHYAGIDLTFDVDTLYSAAEVYAVVYLSYDFGPWNEYSSTDDFMIFGASGADAYSIETELVSGYLTGDYDVLIELFDTYDGSFVASFGPQDSQDLSYLPLEDTGRDTPLPATTVIVHEGGGGSLGLMGLLALLGFAVFARTR
jgi:hypothetical protein